jgi:MHS family proline/betaine transporter-like MFS transporter
VRRCFLIAGAYSAAFNVWFFFVPSYVTATGSSSLATSLGCALVGLLVVGVGAPMFGRLSDRVGRRPVLLGAAGALTIIVVPCYWWMLGGSTIALLIGSGIVGLVLAAFVLPAFLAEQFVARVRATGVGLTYGISSAVVGGTAPLLATLMSRQGPPLLVSAYLAVWGAAAFSAVVRSPETSRSPTRPSTGVSAQPTAIA